MSEKYDRITAHLVSAIEAIASNYFTDTPTMIKELEGRLDKIRRIYREYQDSNPPASVSDGKWILKECYPPSTCRRLLYNDKFIGHVDANTIGPLRTLIARAEIAEKMYEWMCKFQKHTASSPLDPEQPWLDSGRKLFHNRNTLIAEYEALK